MGALGAVRGVKATGAHRRRTVNGKRERFLDHFSATCTVAASAAAAGVPVTTIYRWRRSDPGFAAQWAEALALGMQMIETRLIAHVLAGEAGDGPAGGESAVLEPVRVEDAYRLLGLHKSSAAARVRNMTRRTVSPEEIDRQLTEKLDALARRNRAEAARRGEAAQ